MTKKALIIVDVQNDFITGSLAVPDAAGIISVINKLLSEDFDEVIFTQDWHPANHCSFEENGGPWPVHCVQGSKGAALHVDLQGTRQCTIRKGEDVDIDSYSAFYDNKRKKATKLAGYLKETDITDIYICGLATDYCVKFSVLDAISEGFKTYVVLGACRGVDVEPGDSERALEEMKEAGAILV